jgi:hypothetical protein
MKLMSLLPIRRRQNTRAPLIRLYSEKAVHPRDAFQVVSELAFTIPRALFVQQALVSPTPSRSSVLKMHTLPP